MARWENVKGNLSFLTTGTDEHGQKVQKEAEKRKMDVKSYCDDVASSFQKELQHYSINIGRFIRTTDPDHVTKVKRVWDSLMANGDLYEDNYRGYYCRSDEAFLTAKQVIEKDGSLFCKENGNAVEIVEERNWMFRLQKYKPQLLSFLRANPSWMIPSNFQRDVTQLIEESSQDLSVSRPLSRVPWAIPVGDGNGVYVWLDALTNYLTTSEGRAFDEVKHVIGKDIVKFHGYYYPCLLMALGESLPTQMICHNHWTIGGAKISKSKGNYIPLSKLRAFIPGELIRAYLLTENTLTRDGDFSLEKLLERTNDFSDIYGNLVMRSLGKNIAGPVLERGVGTVQASEETRDRLRHLIDGVTDKYDHVLFSEGYELVTAEMRTMNTFFNEMHPWTITKEVKAGDDSNLPTLTSILMDVWESLRVCSVLLQPIIPTYSTRVLSILFHEDSLNLLPLSELDSHPLEEKHMQCSSERVFQKLSKAEQAKFLRL